MKMETDLENEGWDLEITRIKITPATVALYTGKTTAYTGWLAELVEAYIDGVVAHFLQCSLRALFFFLFFIDFTVKTLW